MCAISGPRPPSASTRSRAHGLCDVGGAARAVPLPAGRRGDGGHASRSASTSTRSRDGRRPSLVPNGTLDMFFDAEPDHGARASSGRRRTFVVMFAGTLGIAQALPSRARRRGARSPTSVEFVLIGDGPVREHADRKAGSRGLDECPLPAAGAARGRAAAACGERRPARARSRSTRRSRTSCRRS